MTTTDTLSTVHTARVDEVGGPGTIVYQARCSGCGWVGARSEVPDPASSGPEAYMMAHNEVRRHIAIERVQAAKAELLRDLTDEARDELQRACTDLVWISSHPTP